MMNKIIKINVIIIKIQNNRWKKHIVITSIIS